MTPLSKLTDNDLINLFVAGNVNALEVLVLRHKDKLYTSILFLVKDKYLAEDIFQDVFIRIIDTMRSGRYTDEGKFLPWAMLRPSLQKITISFWIYPETLSGLQGLVRGPDGNGWTNGWRMILNEGNVLLGTHALFAEDLCPPVGYFFCFCFIFIYPEGFTSL